MKKYFALIGIICLAVSMIVATHHLPDKNKNTNLYDSCDLCGGCVLTPFTYALCKYGADVEWINEHVARIIYKDKVFFINSEEITFKEDGANFNLLLPAPGQNCMHCKCVPNEIYLDMDTANSALWLAGIR